MHRPCVHPRQLLAPRGRVSSCVYLHLLVDFVLIVLMFVLQAFAFLQSFRHTRAHAHGHHVHHVSGDKAELVFVELHAPRGLFARTIQGSTRSMLRWGAFAFALSLKGTAPSGGVFRFRFDGAELRFWMHSGAPRGFEPDGYRKGFWCSLLSARCLPGWVVRSARWDHWRCVEGDTSTSEILRLLCSLRC